MGGAEVVVFSMKSHKDSVIWVASARASRRHFQLQEQLKSINDTHIVEAVSPPQYKLPEVRRQSNL